MKYSGLITSGWRETLTKVNMQFPPISSALSTEENEENLNELPLCCRISYDSCQASCQRSKVWLARLCLKCRGGLRDFIIDKNDLSQTWERKKPPKRPIWILQWPNFYLLSVYLFYFSINPEAFIYKWGTHFFSTLYQGGLEVVLCSYYSLEVIVV